MVSITISRKVFLLENEMLVDMQTEKKMMGEEKDNNRRLSRGLIINTKVYGRGTTQK